MKLPVSQLRNVVRTALSEAMGALKLLDTITMRIILSGEMKIEEIITGIRIIKGVATVSQLAPVNRTPGGRRILDVLVTFDAQDVDQIDYVDAMAQLTRKIPDVRTVILHSLNGQPIRDATGLRKLVY